MTDFPSKGDVLVRPALPDKDPTMNACFMQGTWDLYPTGYQRAATRVYEWIEANGAEQDILVYPFVFNWRMAVELRLKELIWLGRFLTDRPRITKWSHSLDSLWADARTLLEEIDPHESFDAVGGVIADTPNLSLKNFHSVMLKLAAFTDAATGHLGQMASWKADQMADQGWE